MLEVSKAANLASRAVMLAAAAKFAVAAVAVAGAFTAGTLQPGTLSPLVTGLLVLTYAGVGATLTLGGFDDLRCRSLGLFLVVAATAFSDALSARAHPLGGLTAVAFAIRLDVLMPGLLWWFVSEFPSRVFSGSAARWAARAGTGAAAAGLTLGIVNVIADLGGNTGAGFWMERLSRSHKGDLFWPALILLMAPAAPTMALRAFRATATDRRQIRLFALAILGGLLPLSIDVALRAASSDWRAVVAGPAAAAFVQTLVVIAFLTVPFTTAYAVLVARVADLRLILRVALQYAFARYTVIALVLLPLAWLGQFIYARRLLAIQELWSSRAALALGAGVIMAVVALRMRGRALDHLDRRFFREQYDTERVLHNVMTATRSQASGEHVADLLAAEVDQVLHVDRLTVMLRHDAAGQFIARDGRVRALPATSTIVRLLSASDDPLDVDPENPQSVLRRLDPAEVHWLVDGGFRLLVPMRGPDAATYGILALGDKKSELPYSIADRRLLAAVGASGGLSLARQRSASSPTTTANPHEREETALPACECLSCGRVLAANTTACNCGGSLIPAPVPATLAGKFQLDCRLGAGGMGVVYRAIDLTLGRTVAVKALPITGPAETWRLRREARAMALVSHEHLALIYGVESWHGHPFLIVEYLAGGTLADRLRRERIALNEALAIGAQLCDVLERLHAAGLLHRDLKPSNVGYTAAGSVKLLDFGLAQLVAPDANDTTRSGAISTISRGPDSLGRRTQHGFGTPAYMSPEALAGARQSPAFDLWSLSVLLLEAISGTNPFAAKTAFETVQRLNNHKASDVPHMLPGCAEAVVTFFQAALNPNPSARPADASALGARLKMLSRF